MFEDFNEEKFLLELTQAINNEEAKELNIDFEKAQIKKLINDKSQANYFCKLITQLKDERNKSNEFIDKEIERTVNHYEKFREEENKKIDNQIKFFEEALKTFAIEELKNNNKKSIKLPYGTLRFKKQQDRYEYDDKQLLSWLKTNNDTYINTKIVETVDKNKLKKEGFINNGTLYINNIPVEGITIIHQDDKFEIK